jgi:hypothetical protein
MNMDMGPMSGAKRQGPVRSGRPGAGGPGAGDQSQGDTLNIDMNMGAMGGPAGRARVSSKPRAAS